MYEVEKSYWWFAGKRDIIRAVLAGLGGADRRILDIGCGCGLNTVNLNRFGLTFPLDISEKALCFCRERGLKRLVRSGVKPLPFKDNSFELIVASDLIEHLDDDSSALKEFYRVLKKKGIILLTVPAHPFLYSYHDRALGHKRRYKRSELEKKVKESGFFIERLTCFNMFLLPLAFLVRRFKSTKTDTKDKSDFFTKLPCLLNILFFAFLKLESFCIKTFNLPFGVSILILGKKV